MPKSRYIPYYMALSARLAENAAGSTAENPPVGCVIVRGGSIVGYAATARGGRPHAETQALEQAGNRAEGADVYVTLEPCAHTGKTPPCALALINANVRRVYIGDRDPDPRVSGLGVQKLRNAGIEARFVRYGKRFPHVPFIHSVQSGRPHIVLKSASTADGYSAAVNGDSSWITGARARMFGHRLRALADGIIIGARTAITDDPALTCRIPGKEQDSPVRIILDPHGRVPPTLAMFYNHVAPDILVIRREDAEPIYAPELFADLPHPPAFMLCPYSAEAGGFNMQALLKLPPIARMRALLVEGGGKTLAVFMEAGCADVLYHFTAPAFLGDKGAPALSLPAPEYMRDVRRCRQVRRVSLYPDSCVMYAL